MLQAVNIETGKRLAISLAALLVHLLLLAAIIQGTQSQARAQAVEARVTSVRGRAMFSGNGRAESDLTRGVVLAPGDTIDTRGGGRVSIELSDGSLIIVQTNSVVVFADYRNASSLRELLKITVGRVRVRINHFGGKPNPYRVNSPTASIAVRGTEFSVSVESSGGTEVVVYEGLVEVASITNPARRVIVEPGHGVIIRPNEDIRFFVPGPNNEVGERANSLREESEEESEDDSQGSETQVTRAKLSAGSQRSAAGAYERYFESIVENGETPLPSRFTAFPDSYFDSIDNPAYATEFRNTEGRIFILPSVGGTRVNDAARELLGFGDTRPLDFSFSPQTSSFVPLPRLKAVVGGRVALSRDSFQSFTVDDNVALTSSLFTPGETGRRTVDGTTTSRLFTISLMAARRFGSDGRTSLGVGLDYLKTNGSLLNTFIQSDNAGVEARERVESGSEVSRRRFTLGLTRSFRGGQKLGLFYRYGLTSADDRDRSRTLNGRERRLEQTSADSSSSEIGFRLRDSLTRRLFYGIEGSYLTASTDETTQRRRVVDSIIAGRSRRATLGFGFGYALRPQTVFSFDVAAGAVRVRDARREMATGNLLEIENKRAFFLSLHAAVQTDVWRRLFMSGSLLSVTQSSAKDIALYPDRFGRLRTNDGMFTPDGRMLDRFTDYYSNFGVGWRFNRNFLAEYILSTDFGQTSPRHTLLLRYTFGRSER